MVYLGRFVCAMRVVGVEGWSGGEMAVVAETLRGGVVVGG